MTGSCPLAGGEMSTTMSTGPAYRRRQSSAGLEALDDVGDLFVDRLALPHLALDLLHGVDHGRVVAAAEQAGDARVAQVGLLAEHVHRDLAAGDERALTALALQCLDLEAEVPGDLGQQLLVGARLGLRLGEQIGELLLRELGGDRRAAEAGVGGDTDQRALELTDVGRYLRGDE